MLFSVFIFIIALFYPSGYSKDTQGNSDKINLIQPNEEEKEIKKGDILYIDEIKNYEWGSLLIETLNFIEARNIEEIKAEVVKKASVSLKITGPKERLWAWVETDYKGVWNVKWIKGYENHNYYYINEKEKYIGNGILKEDIYSLETGEIIEKADIIAVKEYYNKLEAKREKDRIEREIKEREAANSQFIEIYDAFKLNELAANDKYKGNRYTIIGVFETVKEDGLINTLFKEIGVVVSLKIDNKFYSLLCKFDEKEREKLKGYSKGETIKFTGECVSWGIWCDCKVE